MIGIRSGRRGLWLLHAAVLLALLVMAFFVCYGSAPQLNAGLYGGPPDRDAGTFVFYFWHLKEALLGRADLYWSDRMFYPLGFSMVLQDWSPVCGLYALPFAGLGPLAASNLQLFFGFGLTAFTTYLLAGHLTRRWLLGLLAGLIFAYCEYRIYKGFVHGQPSQAHQEFIPLYLLFLLRFLESGRHRFSLGAGVCFFLATFTSPYQLVFLLLVTPMVLAHHLWQRRTGAANVEPTRRWRGGLARVFAFAAVAGGAAVLLALPIAVANWEAVIRGAPALGEAKLPFTDFVAYFRPFAADHLLFLEETKGVFLGYTLLALTVLTLFWIHRPTGARFWLAMAVFFFLISLGSSLTIDEQRLVDLPFFSLLVKVPFLRGARTASRYASMVVLGLSVAAALTLAHIDRAWLAKRWPVWARAGLGIVLVVVAAAELVHHRFAVAWVDGQTPFRLNLDEAHRVLARQPGSGTVLTFPPIWETANLKIGPHYFARDNFVFHTLHRKRTLAGMGDAVPPATIAYYRDLPFISTLFWLGEGIEQPEPTAADRADARHIAAFLDLRHVLLQRTLLGAAPHPERAQKALKYLAKVIEYKQIYADDRFILLQVTGPDPLRAADTETIRLTRPGSKVQLGRGWLRIDPYGYWIAEGNLKAPGPGALLFRRAAPGELTAEVVHRCSGPPCGGTVELNGQRVGRVSVGWGWQTDQIQLPKHLVRAGINRLRFRLSEARWSMEPHHQIHRIRFKPLSRPATR